jgi:hypothetical protein
MSSARLLVDPRLRSNSRRSSAAGPLKPVVLHAALPGRLRFHLPGWAPSQQETLERRLSMVPGVRQASATPATGNVLLLYDPAVTDPDRLLQAAEKALVLRPSRPRPRPAGNSRDSGSAAPPPSRTIPLVRGLLLNLPAVLALLLSLLTCTTPIGAARLGLEAVQLAIQIGSTA